MGFRGAEQGRPDLRGLGWPLYLTSMLFGDSMVPIIEQDYILLLGLVFYIRNIILLGSTTKITLVI